jgi:thiamine pyrophosphokinase
MLAQAELGNVIQVNDATTLCLSKFDQENSILQTSLGAKTVLLHVEETHGQTHIMKFQNGELTKSLALQGGKWPLSQNQLSRT